MGRFFASGSSGGLILLVGLVVLAAVPFVVGLIGGAVSDLTSSADTRLARAIALHAVAFAVGALLLFLTLNPLLRRSKESEARLRDALHRSELILQCAGEGIYGLDEQGRLTFVNAAAERMLGYSMDDLGRNLVHRVIPRGGCEGCPTPGVECSILEPRADGEPLQCGDAIFRRKDGSLLDVRFVSAPILDSGRTTGAVVVFSDNTENKRNAAVLARWRHIFDSAGWGMKVDDVRSGRIVMLNPAFARMHGYRVDEIDSEFPFAEFYAEECRAALSEHVRLMHEHGHHVWESWHLRKDGTRFPVQIDATAVKDETGEVLYRIVNVQDITERRRAEDVLRESEAHLARAQAQGNLGSWRLDIPNDMLEWSAEAYRIFGVPPGTPMNYQTFLECVHPDDREYVDRAWRAAIAGARYDIQHRIVADGRIKWVRERAELEYSPEGHLQRGVGTTQDITELKRHESELLRSRQNLRELAAHHDKVREQERARIAREIHDEFGQYLTALRMDAAMLRIRFGADNPALARHVEGMTQTIDTTIGVVRSLATSLRPGALDMGLVSAVEWLLAGFEERTGIECRLNVSHETIALDEERGTAVFRIVQESLTNIARHAQASEVEIRIERVEDVLEMDIRDDGVGFDNAEVRARKTFGLLGMRERALQFGGEIQFNSAPGAGTTVRIRIPYTQEAA